MQTDVQHNAKNTLVLGLGSSGLSCLDYFAANDYAAEVFAYDDRFADDRFNKNDSHISELEGLYPKVNFVADKSVIPFFKIDECVATPGIGDEHTVVKRFLDSKKSVVCDVELFARAHQAQEVPQTIVAITGTNGKSTVVSWLAHVLNALGHKTLLAGNIGTPALDCLNGIGDDLASYEYIVLELSSFQLERIQSLSGHVALILNLSPDHMDRYKVLLDYKKAKERIYQNAGAVVINRDVYGLNEPRNIPSMSFGLHDSLEGFEIEVLNEERVVSFSDQALFSVSQLPLFGEHNVSNALAVLTCLYFLKIDPTAETVSALLSFNGLPHRSEFVATVNGVRYVNDSKATNADATVAAVAGDLDQIILIVGGDSKQADLSELKKALDGKLKLAIALGQDADLFVDLFSDFADIEKVATLEEAVNLAHEVARSGDTVLLSPACSSLDMFKNFKERGEVFKQAVKALEEKAA